MRRFAEVDSEILFRLAANAARDGAMDIERFKARIRRCRGQIAAIIACRTDPGTVFVLKGNRPLELRWHPRRKAVLYASDPAYLDAVLAEEKGWREIAVPPMSLVVFRREDLAGSTTESSTTQRTPWGPVYGELSPSTTPKPASGPSTGWRGSTPAVPASTAAFWFRRRPTGPSVRSGSMLLK